MKRSSSNVAVKIATLVQQHGWTQEEFARRAGVNRHTARKILVFPRHAGKLQNATVAGCAQALGLRVNELRDQPLEALLTHRSQRHAYEMASQPELSDWLKRHADRADRLLPDELDELLSLQGTGGPLTDEGIAHFVDQMERRRKIVQQVEAITGTEYLDQLEKLVGRIYKKVQLQPDSDK